MNLVTAKYLITYMCEKNGGTRPHPLVAVSDAALFFNLKSFIPCRIASPEALTN